MIGSNIMNIVSVILLSIAGIILAGTILSGDTHLNTTSYIVMISCVVVAALLNFYMEKNDE